MIKSVQPDFEDQGIEKEYLEELQRLWEHKIIHSQVAEFEGAPPLPPRLSRAERKALEDQNKQSTEGNEEAGPSSQSPADGRSEAPGDSNGHTDADALVGGKRKRSDSNSEVLSGKARAPDPKSNEIGSDLDDTDDDEEANAPGTEGADGEQDMVLCLYDKVCNSFPFLLVKTGKWGVVFWSSRSHQN